VKLVLS